MRSFFSCIIKLGRVLSVRHNNTGVFKHCWVCCRGRYTPVLFVSSTHSQTTSSGVYTDLCWTTTLKFVNNLLWKLLKKKNLAYKIPLLLLRHQKNTVGRPSPPESCHNWTRECTFILCHSLSIILTLFSYNTVGFLLYKKIGTEYMEICQK